MQERKSKQ